MNIENLPEKQEIENILGLGRQASTMRWAKRGAWLAILALVIVGSYLWYQNSQTVANAIAYETSPAKRADLTVTVTATGTIQPTTQIDVSSEMSGVVRAVNVDNNSLIKKGDVLAELDSERFKAQLRSLQASVGSAKAKLADTQATLQASELALTRQKSLQRRGLVITQDLEAAQAAEQRAEAAVASAQADILVAIANLGLKQIDIDKSQILSPVDGIVLKRAVEPGQTVASSLQAPVLFTLAEDLKRMQLEANIDEADIGAVKLGQKANFTVDAFTGRNFPARIEAVEFFPQTTDGVVTYKAVLSVDNSDLALRPGMTATAQVTVQEISNALLVPNAALRYSPPVQTEQQSFSLSRLFLPRMPRNNRPVRTETVAGERVVWVLKDKVPEAVRITTGASDGKMTEVVKGDIAPDALLIISAKQAGK
ncbi:MAG TPA: efflux RND transporter periplasmic adaptor subunit [Aestuariivirga sp.]|jgi:HlyD family secretion protein|nr:efflux RND transporter periplasmic adaptor subunit [Aestuariivirga sp.]